MSLAILATFSKPAFCIPPNVATFRVHKECPKLELNVLPNVQHLEYQSKCGNCSYMHSRTSNRNVPKFQKVATFKLAGSPIIIKKTC